MSRIFSCDMVWSSISRERGFGKNDKNNFGARNILLKIFRTRSCCCLGMKCSAQNVLSRSHPYSPHALYLLPGRLGWLVRYDVVRVL